MINFGASTSTVNGTPSRERHPSSQSMSSPMVMRPAASSSTSSLTTSASTAPTTHPITLENLLALHATAPNPTLAALEQALSERNTVSSQNTQLWKLIEKQRSGYNQVLKELERIRSERDAFKARLVSSGLSGELPKKEKEKDRSKALRPSASNAAISTATATSNGSLDARAPMVRHQSDNTSSFRNEDRPSTPPRMQEPLNMQEPNPQYTHPPEPVQPYIPPVVVPPRVASLASGSSNASSSSSTDRTPRSSDVERSAALPKALQIGNGEGLPRTSIDHDIVTPILTAPAIIQPPQLQPQSLLVPPINNSSPGLAPPSASPGTLSPIIEDARHRESRVSLPDEAKRYIANMGESPAQSPKVSGFGAPQGAISHRFTPAVTQLPINGAVSHSTHAQASATDNTADLKQRESPIKSECGPRDGGDGAVEFLDMGDDDEGTSEPKDDEKKQLRRKNRPRAAVEDFPLPPSHGHIHIAGHPQSPTNLLTPTQAHPQPSALPDASMPSQSSWPSRQPLSPMESVLESPLPSSYLSPTKSSSSSSGGAALTFRALPLVFEDLKSTRIVVSHSSIKPNDRGKEVLSFVIEVDPGNGKEVWKVDKLYSDVLGLDQRVRGSVGKGVGKKMGILPEGKIWRDHAPAKADQRKAALEVYLQSLIELPVKNKDEIIAFFTSDIVREAKKPVMQAGYKEGYLTKRGKNFGGWKTRYFVLQGPVLEYYESRGGAHLGSIVITGAQIGRQQRATETDDEKNYRHAFLVIEAKKGPGGSHPRHVLCAESDAERDSWVDILVRYVSGSYNDESAASTSTGPSPISVNVPGSQGIGSAQPRSSTSSNQDSIMSTPNGKRATRVMSKDDISRGFAIPISQLAPDASNAKLFQAAPLPEVGEHYSPSPTKSIDPSPIGSAGDYYTAEENARRLLERRPPGSNPDMSISSSLPTSSPLEGASGNLVSFRANSELGHYSDLQDLRGGYPRQEPFTPEQNRVREPRRERKSYHPGLGGVSISPPPSGNPDRTPTPDGEQTPVRGGDRAKISGPVNGAPIPAGYKFGSKDAPTESSASNDRREKAKSRSFWGFGRPVDKPITLTSRAVFGIPLEESLEVAEIARLPAVVFRCIQYLEAKKAEQEEGIYRLSGSSAVIKGLKDRFNTEGDVDLLASDEYWDPHAIAVLLKSYLRELPTSILTRDLHLRFLSVIDFVDPQERIRELSHLIASLPIANYSLLRALTAHLILIVQNSTINKMTMRNVGIVFSPTLGIPAGVFSLMLGEFNRVFNVDGAQEDEGEESAGVEQSSDLSRRNSRQYSDAAADQLLGLSGRTLQRTFCSSTLISAITNIVSSYPAPTDDTPSDDADSISLHYESGNDTTENEATVESSHTRSSAGNTSSQHHHLHLDTQQQIQPHNPDLLSPARSESNEQRSRASHVAASRGLNIAISKKGNRHSRMMGLPISPRPPVDSPKSPLPNIMSAASPS
ncbi:hypothetical protein BJ138DRAFT_1111799 [Hygrophoropsis aurantiaca]|uniref:Uncharacterized protein n=1 Tax=Hygrophoropsis aurantiaca TaxID=72124 RepID=A0ACB8AHS0_9AGAM|nr:hypothetical protein BJ138DRAFT_1111799 [Hygrophoropsis aurantiaca]